MFTLQGPAAPLAYQDGQIQIRKVFHGFFKRRGSSLSWHCSVKQTKWNALISAEIPDMRLKRKCMDPRVPFLWGTALYLWFQKFLLSHKAVAEVYGSNDDMCLLSTSMSIFLSYDSFFNLQVEFEILLAYLHSSVCLQTNFGA